MSTIKENKGDANRSLSGHTEQGLSDESDHSFQKRKYNQVDVDLRKELLHAIETKQLSIKSASEQLGINYSTAKNIVRIYRKEKRMHKLPKRVNKALEEVLKAWKIPGKKLPRFVAKKCSLFEEKRTKPESDTGNADSTERKVKIVEDCNAAGQVPEIEKLNKGLENKPFFDFFVYTPLILESWKRKKASQMVVTPQTVWTVPCIISLNN